MKDSNSFDNSIKLAKANIQTGALSAAETELKKVLQADAAHQEALYCLAVCQRKRGEHSLAEHTLNTILKAQPNNGHAYQERGHNFLAAGDQDKALQAFETAVEINPALHGAWRVLANTPANPKMNDAQRQYAWLSSLPPELVSVSSFIHQNKLRKAETLCRQYLKKHPHHPEAMRLLAKLGVKFQILDDAEFLLQQCLELHPNHLHARLDYTEVLQRRQKFPQALEQARKLYEFDPNNAGFQVSLANAQQANANYTDAINSYRHALNKPLPEKASVYVALGNALKTIGETEQAVTAYQHAYREQADFGDAYWSLANLKTYTFSDSELSAMQRQLESGKANELDQARISFALGKAYEDRKEFKASFTYYEQGNQIKARENRFDLERLQTELNHQKEHFTQHFFEQRNDFGCSSTDPIFIVGLPRAGSTLLEQILASHSQVDGTMELANIIGYAHRFNGRSSAQQSPQYPSVLAQLSKEQSQSLGQKYIDETQHHRQGGRFFIDKMPNNFRHIALIKLILPNAKIIDARRDPMACCFSGYKQLFAEGQEFSYSLSAIGQYYSEYLDIMRHWHNTCPDLVLTVNHENVLDDLEGEVRKVLDFCGLEYEQACVDFHKSKRAVRTPSSEQVRQPIFKTAMQQWRNYEDYLTPLKNSLPQRES